MNEPLVINAVEKEPASKARAILIALSLAVLIGGAVLIGIGQKHLLGSNALPSDPFARAQALMASNVLFDGNNGVTSKWQNAFNGAVYNGSVNFAATAGFGWSTDTARLKVGEVGAQVFSAAPSCGAANKDAVRIALEQIDIVNKFTAFYSSVFAPATTAAAVTTNFQGGLISALVGVRGGHAIDASLGALRAFYTAGARFFSLFGGCGATYTPDPIGSSATQADTGLTAFGRAVVVEANRLGLVVDAFGASPTTLSQILALSSAPIIVSSSGAAAVCDDVTKLNLSDDQLKAIAAKNGVVQVTFDPAQVACATTATLDQIVNVITHIVTVQGTTANVAFGSSFDAMKNIPADYTGVDAFVTLVGKLLVSFSDSDVLAITGGNSMRVFQAAQSAAALSSPPQEMVVSVANDVCRT